VPKQHWLLLVGGNYHMGKMRACVSELKTIWSLVFLMHCLLCRDLQSNQCKLQGQCQPPPPQCTDITDKTQCSSRGDCC
jgi:hypothetical protein